LFARAQIILDQLAPAAYRVFVRASYARYLWAAFADAAAEFGAVTK
jgi:sarcosine oxidase gamma subunit